MSIEVQVTFPAGKRVDAAMDGFTISTDQKIKDGGEGTAPTPFQLFWASLATCAGHYAKGFCEKRNIPTDGLALSMTCEFDEKKKMYTRATTFLTLPPDFPEKYHNAISKAVSACYVKKHVQDAPEFVVEIV